GRRGARGAGKHEVAMLVLERGLRHVRLQHIGELDIADGDGRLLDGRRHGGIPGRALANRPGNRLAPSYLAGPFRTYRRQVVGKDVGRAATVRTVDDMDVLVRQADAAVVSLESGVVPFLDHSEEDPGNRLRCQLELAAPDALQVVRQLLGAERAIELDHRIAATYSIAL